MGQATKGGGMNTFSLNRVRCVVGATAARNLKIIFANYQMTGGSGEVSVGNAFTLQAAIECSAVFGTSTPQELTFGGASSVTVGDLAVVTSDVITESFPAGTVVYLRMLITVAAGKFWPLGQAIGANQQAGRQGTDNAAALTQLMTAGSLPAVNATFLTQSGIYPPASVIGLTAAPQVSCAFAGDSIADGSSDVTGDGTGGMGGGTTGGGFILRGLGALNIPSAKLARGSELLRDFANPALSPLRRARLSSATHFLSELGSNDITGGRTLAQMQADYLTAWGYGNAAGCHVAQTLILPRTDAAGTTPVSGFGVGELRDQINDWIVAQVGQGVLDEAIDINSAVEGVGNTWLSNMTSDGTHPIQAGHEAITTVFQAAADAWEA